MLVVRGYLVAQHAEADAAGITLRLPRTKDGQLRVKPIRDWALAQQDVHRFAMEVGVD
jgi:hypothetical protein